MKKSIKVLSLLILIATVLTTTVFAEGATRDKKDVTISKESDTVVTKTFYEGAGKVTKQMENVDVENKLINMMINVKNENPDVVEKLPSEVVLLIDNSATMTERISQLGGSTRYDVVARAAKKLSESMLAKSADIKIGVVRFSCSEADVYDAQGNFVGASTNDARVVQSLTSNLSEIESSIDGITCDGPLTDIQVGLRTAQSVFSSEENLKYLIVLSDGDPNLALGETRLGYRNSVIKATYDELKAINASGINVITCMSNNEGDGLPLPREAQDNDMTYKQIADYIFNNPLTPDLTKFYYVEDTRLTTTITEDILADMFVTRSAEIKDIVIDDYFPDYILSNFDYRVTAIDNNPTKGTVSDKVNELGGISWNVGTLAAGEEATLRFQLVLKDQVEVSVLDKVLNTNKKLDVTYTDYDGNRKTETTDESPSVRLVVDLAPTPIPQTGTTEYVIIITAAGLVILGIVAGIKYKRVF